MTATATMYTQFGFAIAADGRQRWANLPTRDDFIRRSESDTVQKLFPFTGEGIALAYVVRGDVANRDRSFDIGTALADALTGWRNRQVGDVYPFLQLISLDLERYVHTSKKENRIEEYPETFIDFVGYNRERPFWVELQFLRSGNPITGSLYQLLLRKLWSGGLYRIWLSHHPRSTV